MKVFSYVRYAFNQIVMNVVIKTFITICVFIGYTLFSQNVIAQSVKVSNVHYRTIDQKIEIFYDLPQTKDSINISIVFKKKSDVHFWYFPKYISGDIGKGVFFGKNHKICWHIKNEPTSLFTGKEFYFRIFAYKIPKKVVIIDDIY